MKIFTFLGPVRGKFYKEEMALVDLWRANWTAQGWEPIVLTPDSLLRDRETKRLLQKFKQLPSRNKHKLDMWCYARWLAVHQQGGGFMCDYDVINYGFQPRVVTELICYSSIVPCLVSGSAEDYLRVVRWFDQLQTVSSWKLWKRFPHISDMLVLEKRQTEFKALEECIGYGETGWETASAVHYSNFGMKPKGYMPRDEWIPKLRPLA